MDWYLLGRVVDPWGEERADLRAGVVASAALAPYMPKGRQAPSPDKFLLYRPEGKEPVKTQSPEDQRAVRDMIRGSGWKRKS